MVMSKNSSSKVPNIILYPVGQKSEGLTLT